MDSMKALSEFFPDMFLFRIGPSSHRRTVSSLPGSDPAHTGGIFRKNRHILSAVLCPIALGVTRRSVYTVPLSVVAETLTVRPPPGTLEMDAENETSFCGFT